MPFCNSVHANLLLAYRGRHSAICQIDLKPAPSKIRQNLAAVAYPAKPFGISHCDGRDMPTVTPTFVQIATVGELEAESWQNPPDLENQLLHQWMCYSFDCCFKTADF
jgi:hypothetical protein